MSSYLATRTKQHEERVLDWVGDAGGTDTDCQQTTVRVCDLENTANAMLLGPRSWEDGNRAEADTGIGESAGLGAVGEREERFGTDAAGQSNLEQAMVELVTFEVALSSRVAHWTHPH